MVGKTLGHYRVLELLGRGGMGEVYLAQDIHLERKVALKILPTKCTHDETRLLRFIQEAKAASGLNHPNILTIYEIGTADEVHFIATEFIDGPTLRQRLTRNRLKLEEALDIASQIASALAAAHDSGIVHRDIKPANIMLRRDGFVKVLDFGLAKLIEKNPSYGDEDVSSKATLSLTDLGTVIGTIHYMSPEQARGLKVDARTDIFSLGVVLYEMTAGRMPFEGGTKSDILVSLLEKEPPPLARYAPELPETLEWIVSKCLAKDRQQRYSSSRDLLQDLKRLRQRQEVQLELQRSAPPPAPVIAVESSSIVREIGALSSPPATEAKAGLCVAILYKRNNQPDEHLLELIETELAARGHKVFVDRHLIIGMEWAREIERQVRTSDAVIPLLSQASIMSEMLAYEVQIAHEAAQQQGKPRLLPVRVQLEGPLPEPLGALLNPIHYTLWKAPEDDPYLLAELQKALEKPGPVSSVTSVKLEPPGGAVPLDSQFYIVRPADEEFRAAIARQDSIVLVKGARQMGKTSLLARALQQARESGTRVALTDFQKLNSGQLASPEALFIGLAEMIAEQLDLKVFPEDVWNARRGPSINFERYLRREVLSKIAAPLVWGMDEVDRLFTRDFGGEVFGLFRSWHNERALDPAGPWRQLTLAIAYATEAHLFISDMNQSPFNVGTRLTLEDFSFEQVMELNQRYGSPLHDKAETARFFRLVSGHPYLVRRGLHELATKKMTLAVFEAQADRDEGPFGDHLRRILVSLVQDPMLCDVVRGVLQGRPCPTADSFYRLRSAGVMVGDAAQQVRPRCQLYATYLERHLL